MNRRFALVLALATCTTLAFRLRAPAGAPERSPGPATNRLSPGSIPAQECPWPAAAVSITDGGYVSLAHRAASTAAR